MRFSARPVLSLAVLGFALSVLAALPGCGKKLETIKIGHVAPLTGPQAHYGKDNENGARLAIEDLNARGWMIDGKKAVFELLAEDDAADPKQGAAVAQKLCDAKVTGVVGHLNSGTTLPASTIYNKCGLPQISPSATNPKYTQQGFENAYRMLANDNALGALIARTALALGARSAAVIDDRTAYGQGVAEIFRKVASESGIKIVSDQYTDDRATDFNAILTEVKSKKPDVIFYGGMDSQAGPLLRQMEQQNILTPRLLGGDGICTEKIVELSGHSKLLSNVICAIGAASPDKMPGYVGFRRRYDEKYPKEYQVYAPYVYDAVMTLADAMRRADSTNPRIYARFLRTADFTGITGRVRFDAQGDLLDPQMSLFTYANGVRVPANLPHSK